VLGPLLFLIYINDLTNEIKYSSIKMFADDTCLLVSDKSEEKMAYKLNYDLKCVSSWADRWLVNFSSLKTESLFVSKHPIRANHSPIMFLGDTVKQVDHHKHLGVIISHDLTWNTHIDNTIKTCSNRLNLMKVLKYKLDRKSLETIYCSFIRPKLEYGDVLFTNCPKYLLDKLYKFEFEALKTITGAITGTSTAKLIIEYGKPLLSKRRNIHVLCLLYKIIAGDSPHYLVNILNSFKRDPRYQLRENHNYILPKTKSSAYLKFFSPTPYHFGTRYLHIIETQNH
jgi:hypothetical protein